MSPHAVREEVTSIDLGKYAVTKNAFLPGESPATSFSDTYYEPWEQIVQILPDLINRGQIRNAVLQMPILSTDQLATEAEWRRAYSLLAFLTHAYIWGGDKPSEVCIPSTSFTSAE